MKRKSVSKGQGGFTLIEIIAVLILLGILAAVAVPKYIDLTGEAKKKAMEGALAEGMSTVSMNYAYLMLSNSGVATTAQVAARASANSPASGDFSYTFAADAEGVLVTVGAKAGGAVSDAADATKTWVMP